MYDDVFMEQHSWKGPQTPGGDNSVWAKPQRATAVLFKPKHARLPVKPEQV